MKKKFRKRLIRFLLYICSKNVKHPELAELDYSRTWLWSRDMKKLRTIDRNLYDSIKSFSKYLANKPNHNNYI